MYIIILGFVVVYFFSYFNGKKVKEYEIKKNTEIHKKKIKKISSVELLKKQLKNGKFVLIIILLTSCVKKYNTLYCIEPQNYTIEEQQIIKEILSKENNITLNNMIIELYNYRKLCKNNF